MRTVKKISDSVLLWCRYKNQFQVQFCDEVAADDVAINVLRRWADTLGITQSSSHLGFVMDWWLFFQIKAPHWCAWQQTKTNKEKKEEKRRRQIRNWTIYVYDTDVTHIDVIGKKKNRKKKKGKRNLQLHDLHDWHTLMWLSKQTKETRNLQLHDLHVRYTRVPHPVLTLLPIDFLGGNSNLLTMG